MNIARRISPATFVLAAVCFFMPFFNVSCEGRPVCKITGMHLVVGAKAEDILVEKGGSKKPQAPSVPEPLAVAALACAFMGALSGIPMLRRSGGSLAVFATIGVLAWFWLRPALAEPKPPEAALRAEAIHIGIVLGVMTVSLIASQLAGAGKRFAPQVPVAALGATLLVWLIVRANLDWVGALFRDTPSKGSGPTEPQIPFTVDLQLGIVAAIVFLLASGIVHVAMGDGDEGTSKAVDSPA
jgi:hypothetical protein